MATVAISASWCGRPPCQWKCLSWAVSQWVDQRDEQGRSMKENDTAAVATAIMCVALYQQTLRLFLTLPFPLILWMGDRILAHNFNAEVHLIFYRPDQSLKNKHLKLFSKFFKWLNCVSWWTFLGQQGHRMQNTHTSQKDIFCENT